jgi:hypothetical protein
VSTEDRLPAVETAFAELLSGGEGRDAWLRIDNSEGAITLERLSREWGDGRRAVILHGEDPAEVYWDVPVDERRHVVVTAELSEDSTVRWLRLVRYSL